MLKVLYKIKFITSIILSFVLISNPALAAGKYTFSETRKENPQDFNDFLYSCTPIERIQMLQALQALPKLKDEYFGKLEKLPELNYFAKNKNEASASKPLKPATFNEVWPETVLDAVRKDIIKPADIWSPAIRKELVWRSYNKWTYCFRGDDAVDYHGIVQWAAEKNGISKELVSALPTFALERKIAEKYFEMLWDKLSPEQKKEVLDKVEKETGKTIHDKRAISYMGGSAALAALAVTINIIGFPFYVLLTTTIHAVAAFLGLTLPWIVYQTATTLAAILGSTVGFAISGVLFVIGLTFLGSSEKDTVSAFIMTVNMIKTARWVK